MSGQNHSLAGLAQTQPPEMLYHYTSIAGLKGIVQTRRVWATIVHYLNDAKEFRHAMDVVRNLMSQRRDDTTDRASIDFYTNLGESLPQIRGVNACAFSLSAKGDLLSQWRGYCPPEGGYSIGFQTDLLRPHLQRQNFDLVPCVYDHSAQQNLLRVILDDALSKFRRLTETKQADQEQAFEASQEQFFFDFSRVVPVLKDPAFAEEGEWRAVLSLVSSRHPQMGYRVNKSMAVPHFELELESKEHPLPLREIVVGPMQYQELAMNGLSSLFEREHVSYWSIRRSLIPYRLL